MVKNFQASFHRNEVPLKCHSPIQGRIVIYSYTLLRDAARHLKRMASQKVHRSEEPSPCEVTSRFSESAQNWEASVNQDRVIRIEIKRGHAYGVLFYSAERYYFGTGL